MNKLEENYPFPFLKEKPFVYYLWLNTVGRLLAYACRTKVIGAEHLPLKGPVLITANHKSYLDPPLIAWALTLTVFFL
jgi:1-acyl-sn-glycerol-3-phosphate acyltransferase